MGCCCLLGVLKGDGQNNPKIDDVLAEVSEDGLETGRMGLRMLGSRAKKMWKKDGWDCGQGEVEDGTCRQQ